VEVEWFITKEEAGMCCRFLHSFSLSLNSILL
jgi:hypothetical protein